MSEGQRDSRDEALSSSKVTELVERAFCRGDPETVQQVHRRVRRIIGFRGFRIPREERRDLEQEVMTQLWQAARDSRIEPGSRFWGFVETVASRRLIDWLRVRRETVPLDGLAATEPGPLGDALAKERADLASAVVRRLPGSCRQLIQLRLVEGRKYADISHIVHKGEGALRVQMHRCIVRAREILDELRKANRGHSDSMKRA